MSKSTSDKPHITLSFIDQDSGGEGIAIVRVIDKSIGITLSLKDDGDCEAFLTIDDAKRLVRALDEALSISDNSK